MKTLFALLAALLLSTSVFAQQDLAPDALVKSVADDVLLSLRTDKDLLNGDLKKAMDLVETKILPYFDFESMTADTVGKASWRGASATQKQRLIGEFKMLLVRTYATSISSYKSQTIRFKPLKLDSADTTALVRSEILQPGGQPVQADYLMEKGDKGWKVLDVRFAGVSLAANYKSVFAQEVSNGGVDGLIDYLVARNKALEAKRNKGNK
jgi:phospholipid transport system substrate-binding protein